MTIIEDRPTTTIHPYDFRVEPIAAEPVAVAVEVGAPKPYISIKSLLTAPITHWRETHPGRVERTLVQALDVLGPNGENWIKGAFERNGKFCAAGAVAHVAGRDIRTYRDSMDVLNSLVEYRVYWSVPGYNDHPETTFADVKNLFLRGIAKAHREFV